uniref:Synaptotagmin 6 n=1 Tax=Paramormyrops kingsleyae TaxID=1676925 RepID=A0A3B3S2F8_9TELE
MATEKLKEPSDSTGFLEAAVKISHTSPDIPAEVQLSMKEHFLRRAQRMQRQTTEPASSTRHSSFKRHLPRQMQVASLDLGNDYVDADLNEQPTSIGRIKPELYVQKTQETEDASKNGGKTCGKINFSLRYDYENEALLVNILKAFDLPAKDLCGSSDPYVKIYLLPDRKQKYQTRVHRKTLNPTFDESFQFPVPYEELSSRKLHLTVFDFDRFSRHDMIGEVIVDNLFEASDLSRETSIWKDIQYATTESVDLGEVMFSLCYLPTAGRLTLTVIKCRNLKAMDITGYSGWATMRSSGCAVLDAVLRGWVETTGTRCLRTHANLSLTGTPCRRPKNRKRRLQTHWPMCGRPGQPASTARVPVLPPNPHLAHEEEPPAPLHL